MMLKNFRSKTSRLEWFKSID